MVSVVERYCCKCIRVGQLNKYIGYLQLLFVCFWEIYVILLRSLSDFCHEVNGLPLNNEREPLLSDRLSFRELTQQHEEASKGREKQQGNTASIARKFSHLALWNSGKTNQDGFIEFYFVSVELEIKLVLVHTTAHTPV